MVHTARCPGEASMYEVAKYEGGPRNWTSFPLVGTRHEYIRQGDVQGRDATDTGSTEHERRYGGFSVT